MPRRPHKRRWRQRRKPAALAVRTARTESAAPACGRPRRRRHDARFGKRYSARSPPPPGPRLRAPECRLLGRGWGWGSRGDAPVSMALHRLPPALPRKSYGMHESDSLKIIDVIQELSADFAGGSAMAFGDIRVAERADWL